MNIWWALAGADLIKQEIDRAGEIGETQSQVSQTKLQTQILEANLERLYLITRTLYQMLLDKKVMTEQDFTSLFKKLDLEDGLADGKRNIQRRKITVCQNCERKTPGNRPICLYCGTTLSDFSPL